MDCEIRVREKNATAVRAFITYPNNFVKELSNPGMAGIVLRTLFLFESKKVTIH
jgi:hypothetical protein